MSAHDLLIWLNAQHDLELVFDEDMWLVICDTGFEDEDYKLVSGAEDLLTALALAHDILEGVPVHATIH